MRLKAIAIKSMISFLICFSIQAQSTQGILTKEDTLRYTLVPQGVIRGERTSIIRNNIASYRIQVGPNIFESTVQLNAQGIPTEIKINGNIPEGKPWMESFVFNGNLARWENPLEIDSIDINQPQFYVAVNKPYFQDLIFNALLKSKTGKIPVLPAGVVELKHVLNKTIQSSSRQKHLKLYSIHGLKMAPFYLWADDKNNVFADEVSIRAGWEETKSVLDQISKNELAKYLSKISNSAKLWPDNSNATVIKNARIFDPKTKKLAAPGTIIIQGNKIKRVGIIAETEFPENAKIIDAHNKTILPGLWDMHVHFHLDKCDQASALLFAARGITTVRDLGGESDLISFIQNQTEKGNYVGPEILPALIMYGAGNSGMGANVANKEQARLRVKEFHEQGYVQAKIYNSVPDSIVPAVADEAHKLNMRVSGHIPFTMTGNEVINAGFDEIQHLFYFRIGVADTIMMIPDIGTRMAEVDINHLNWKDFVGRLKDENIAIDPTMAIVEESPGRIPFPWLEKAEYDMPAQVFRNASYTKGPLLPPDIIAKQWGTITSKSQEILWELYKEDIQLIPGTDASLGGFELARELELFVESGIPAPEVLTMVTYEAAKIMGMEQKLGSVETGKMADFIIIDGNPLQDISEVRKIELLIKNGIIYDVNDILEGMGLVKKIKN